MNYQKAFKILGSLVDSSVNFHSYSEAQRDRFHTMSYWFKQVIEYSADYGTQYDYTQQCIRRFTEEVNMFNKKYSVDYPYVLRIQELLDEVRAGEILQEEKLAAWKPFMTHLTLMKGWIIKTNSGLEKEVDHVYGKSMINFKGGGQVSIHEVVEYRIPQNKPQYPTAA